MPEAFDNLAASYYKSIPELPQEFIDLVVKCFELSSSDKIIDLGCGSGSLALALSKYSLTVEAIDSSEVMIDLARRRDQKNQVKWIHRSVEDHDFGQENFKLIIAFEAFHLFENHKQLIQKLGRSLSVGGYLCIGWVNYSWEGILKNFIKETFAPHGISWDDWGYWSVPDFADSIQKNGMLFTQVEREKVEVIQDSSITSIINFFLSIEKTHKLDGSSKRRIEHQLLNRMNELFDGNSFSGIATYLLKHSRRL